MYFIKRNTQLTWERSNPNNVDRLILSKGEIVLCCGSWKEKPLYSTSKIKHDATHLISPTGHVGWFMAHSYIGKHCSEYFEETNNKTTAKP